MGRGCTINPGTATSPAADLAAKVYPHAVPQAAWELVSRIERGFGRPVNFYVTHYQVRQAGPVPCRHRQRPGALCDRGMDSGRGAASRCKRSRKAHLAAVRFAALGMVRPGNGPYRMGAAQMSPASFRISLDDPPPPHRPRSPPIRPR